MSEEKKIKVVLLEPGKLARTAEIGTSIEDLQNAVDGLIERIALIIAMQEVLIGAVYIVFSAVFSVGAVRSKV